MGEETRNAAPEGPVRRSRLLGQTVRYILRVAHLARVKAERQKALSAAILPDEGTVEPSSLSGVER